MLSQRNKLPECVIHLIYETGFKGFEREEMVMVED
jgi:hypothetical protein